VLYDVIIYAKEAEEMLSLLPPTSVKFRDAKRRLVLQYNVPDVDGAAFVASLQGSRLIRVRPHKHEAKPGSNECRCGFARRTE
jgi:hypothetical protein